MIAFTLSDTDSDDAVAPAPAPPRPVPGAFQEYVNRQAAYPIFPRPGRQIEIDLDLSEDDLDDDEANELAFLHQHHLAQHAPPQPGRLRWPFAAIGDLLDGIGGGGGVGGLEARRPIGLEQQWRDAGAFAPPEALPTRRLFSRNCELEVQGVEEIGRAHV